jgi:hypothetical protein
MKKLIKDNAMANIQIYFILFPLYKDILPARLPLTYKPKKHIRHDPSHALPWAR